MPSGSLLSRGKHEGEETVYSARGRSLDGAMAYQRSHNSCAEPLAMRRRAERPLPERPEYRYLRGTVTSEGHACTGCGSELLPGTTFVRRYLPSGALEHILCSDCGGGAQLYGRGRTNRWDPSRLPT